MGMWDLRCMVTGLPLTPNDPATAVLLARVGDGYRPIALGLRGIYNCYGTIDSVVEDVNAGLVWAWATQRLADGRLAIGAGEVLEPTGEIDHLLEVVERNGLLFPPDDPVGPEPAVTLDGQVLHHGLIYQPVWDALATGDAPAGSLLESAIAREIYHERLAEVADLVRQLAAVDAFLAAHDVPWAPPGEERQRYANDPGAQFSVDELRAYVEEARRDWWDVEALRPAIDEADRGVREYEAEAETPLAPALSALAALTSLEVKRAVAVDENGNPI